MHTCAKTPAGTGVHVEAQHNLFVAHSTGRILIYPTKKSSGDQSEPLACRVAAAIQEGYILQKVERGRLNEAGWMHVDGIGRKVCRSTHLIEQLFQMEGEAQPASRISSEMSGFAQFIA